MTTDRATRGPLLVVAAASAAAAGLVHGAAAGAHADVARAGLLLAVMAVLQLGWAVLAMVRPTRPVLVSGAVVNLVVVLAWAMSRTVGWPGVGAMSEALPVGFSDLAGAMLAGVAGVAAVIAWVDRPVPRWVGTVPAPVLATLAVFALAVPAVAAPPTAPAVESDPHAHGPDADHAAETSHSHDDTEHHVADGDGHDHASADELGSAYDHDDPVISLDDPRLSPEQRAAAQALVDDVRAEMERFTDIASVEAEGYVSIGDGITGFEHFSHPVLREDPITMDPRRPESIVYQVHPDGSREMVSAMFIMPPGSTIDDVPDIAGTLTTWHDHQDLCWLGNRVVGVTGPDGSCAFGEFRVGQPMLHVWLVPHPCGPFSGLEGHGGDCRQHAH